MKPAAAALLALASTLSLAASQCADFCWMEYVPVCGTDDATYMNECLLAQAACLNPELDLAKAYDGECGTPASPDETTAAPSPEPPAETPTVTMLAPSSSPAPASASCPTLCTEDPFLQCGSDGETYTNACEFALAQCRNASLTFVASGPCPSTARV